MGLAVYEQIAAQVGVLRSQGRSVRITSGEGVLSTHGLREILFYEPAELIATCQAGVTLAALQERLATGGQFLPVWHPSPQDVTVGALVASAYTGLGRSLFGPLRDRILEVHVATGEGKLVRGGAKVVKSVTGFDLPRLMCGSMGTLGVIVEVTLKVHPRPTEMFVAAVDDPFAMWRAAPSSIEAAWTFDGTSWAGHTFALGPVADARVLLGPTAQPGWERFETVAGADVLVGGTRVRALPSRITELVRGVPSLRGALVDVASGDAWIQADASAAGRLRDAGATVIGGDVAPSGLEIMRRLKREFDPDGVLPDPVGAFVS